MTCIHGTTHTEKEGQQAIAWASQKYPGKDLADIKAACWILLWRKEVEE